MPYQSTSPNAKTEWGGRVVSESSKTQSILLSMSDLLSHKWYPIIVYHLLSSDPMGFSDLEDAIEDISSKMLSESLKQLENDHGLVERSIRDDRPLRTEYRLTDSGEDFGTVVDEMRRWGEQQLSATDSNVAAD